MSLVVVLALVVGAAGLALAAVWASGLRMRKMLEHLPTYPDLQYFTSFFTLITAEDFLVKFLQQFSVVADAMKQPFLVWIGISPVVVCHDLDDVKKITNTFVEKPYLYSFLRLWFGDGVLTAAGPQWKRSIKVLGSTFSTATVESYQMVFNTQSQILAEKMKSEIGKPPFEVMRKYLAYCTLETFVQTALGVPKISESIVTSEYYDALTRIMCQIQERIFNVPCHLDFVYRLTPAYREMKKNIAIMHKTSDVIIEKRLKAFKEKKNKTDGQNDLSEQPALKYSYLDMMLELQDKHDFLTLEQIKDEVDTIILGGQETVATTLSFLLMAIGQKEKEHIQDKMVEELKEIFGDSKRPVHTQDFAKMKYCEMVILETLRLYPAVLIVARYADKDLQLRSCTVPKGTTCAINIWGAGRSRSAWGPDALEFRPERWEGVDHNSPYISYMPFSFGRRACIGKKYALSFMKTMLVYLLREMRFTCNIDMTRLKTEMVVLRAEDGHMVTVSKR